MDRQTILAFVLIGVILVVWLYLTAPEPDKQPPVQQDSTIVKDTLRLKDTTETPVRIEPEETVKADTNEYGRYFTSSGKSKEIIVVENELVRIEFSTKGGNLNKVFLKEFNNWYSAHKNNDEDDFSSHVQLLNYKDGNTYDLAFVSSDGKAINTGNIIFEPDNRKWDYNLEENDSLTLNFTYTVEPGKYITKSYTIYGNKYNFESRIDLVGMNDLISNNAVDLLWDTGIRFVEKNSVDEANYANASVYYGDEQVIVDGGTINEPETKEFRGNISWMAVRNKYFSGIIIPHNPSEVEGAYLESYQETFPNEGIREHYSARLILPFRNTDRESYAFTLFVGPVDYDILSNLGNNLTALVDFGSFFGLKFIVRPIAEYVLLPLFQFLHLFIPNYGFVIIVFSFIIKLVLYPLTKKSYQSMKRMQALQPKIAEIKEKYKDDPQKVNKETMKLYSTYGVNPAGGCLPLLLQMPIFVALWGLFQTAIELRQQPFILWINDLSRPDVIYDLGFQLPLVGIQYISGLALLMGITTFFQQKMSMKDPKQQQLVYIMPVMLTLLFMSFPSGLNLYYFMFNVLSIAQQYYINHKGGDVELQPVKNPKKKGGFMARMMEAAEKQAKTQQKKKR